MSQAVENMLARYQIEDGDELQSLLAIIELAAPDCLDEICAALVTWRDLVVARERLRVLEVLREAIRLDLTAEGLEWACKTDMSAKSIVAALNQRAAAQPSGRPS